MQGNPRPYIISHFAPAILLLLSLFLTGGCAKKPARVARIPGGERSVRAVTLERDLRSYIDDTKRVKALARMEIVDGDGMRKTDAALVIVRPSSIRIDAMDSLADVWASVGSDGNKLWFYLPAKDKLYRGRANRRNLNRVANFNLELNDLIAILTGSPMSGNDFYLLQVGADDDGHFVDRVSAVHIWTSGKDSRIIRCVKYKADGDVIDSEILFSDFRRVGDAVFPHRIEARFPGERTAAVVEYDDVSFDGEVDRSIFVHKRGKGSRLGDLKGRR